MSKKSPIAIVGVSALFPSSNDATQFWQHIVNGKDLTSKVPTDYWLTEDYYDSNPSAEDKTYSKRGAFLDGIDFNCSEFGILPNSAEATDTSQLLALIAAKHVLADITKQHFQEIDLAKASIILGATGAQELMLTAAARLDRPLWLQGLREHGIAENKAQKICDAIAKRYTPWQESTFPGLLGNVIAGRIANRFDLGGSNCVVDAACASSLAACKMGISELQLGDSDLVITGGVDTMQNISMYMCFSKTPALSKTDDCRPFSDKADGTLLGEGLCFIAMKRLADAKRDNNYIYAVIHGIGASSDGKGKSVYAPASEGQAHALANAYENANYSPTTVELVEAHGTGTIAGDAAEFEGLRSVFCAAKHDDKLSNWCALGSIKSQIGHTKSTAGAAGLFKAVMALNHKILPPTIKVDKPNPALNIEQSPFYLNAKARPWIRDNKHPRRASVSAFGFGGSNFHVTLEEYQNKTPQKLRYRTLPSELFIFHASSAADI
nr:hypothetical protein [Gammaproteobacteria bacterium]